MAGCCRANPALCGGVLWLTRGRGLSRSTLKRGLPIAYRQRRPSLGRWFLSKLKDEGLLAAPGESAIVRAGVPQSTCVVLSGTADRAMVSCYSSNRLMQALARALALALAPAFVQALLALTPA